MNLWQSLLIALVPAAIAAGVSILTAILQINKAKADIDKQYDLKTRLHISQLRYDTEFAIYKELSEKLVTLISDCISNLFPCVQTVEPTDIQSRLNYRKSVYCKVEKAFKEAHYAINKYAIFIPEEWYKEFVLLKNLCRIQIQTYFVLGIIKCGAPLSEEENKIKDECCLRSKEIEEKFDAFVIKLRKHVNELNIKGVTDNGD